MQEQPFPSFKQAFPWVGFVACMFLLTYVNRAMFGPIIPKLKTELGITHSQATAFMLSMAFGYTSSIIASARTCSLLQPRLIVSISIICCGLVLLLTSNATSIFQFHVLFFAIGVTTGHYFNAGMSTMRSLVKPVDWPKAITVHEFGPALSFVFGPALIGLTANAIGWRPTVAGMGILTLTGGLLFLFLAKGGRTIPQRISLKGVATVVRQPRFWLFAWLLIMGIGGELGPYSVLNLYMEQERGLSPNTASLLLTCTRILPPIALLFGGWITTRANTKTILTTCISFYAMGLFLMALPWDPSLFIGMTIQPLATALAFPSIFNVLAESFTIQDQPLLLALCTPIGSLIGGGLFPKFLGFCGDTISYSTGFAVLGLLVLLTLPMLKNYRKTIHDRL